MKYLHFVNLFLIFLSSCTSITEKDAQELAERFFTDYKFGNLDKLTTYYPKFTHFTRPVTIEDFTIEKTNKEQNESFTVYATVKLIREEKKVILFMDKSADNLLFIKNSKGLALYNGLDHSKCFKIGCFERSIDDLKLGEKMRKCDEVEDKIASLVFNHLDMDKDIVINSDVRIGGDIFDRYAQVKIKNQSSLDLQGKDFYCSIDFFNSKGMLVESVAFKTFMSTLKSGGEITLVAQEDLYLVPQNISSFKVQFGLRNESLVDILNSNKQIIKFNCDELF